MRVIGYLLHFLPYSKQPHPFLPADEIDFVKVSAPYEQEVLYYDMEKTERFQRDFYRTEMEYMKEFGPAYGAYLVIGAEQYKALIALETGPQGYNPLRFPEKFHGYKIIVLPVPSFMCITPDKPQEAVTQAYWLQRA